MQPLSHAAVFDGRLISHLLVLVAEHHPGDADSHAEGRQQQHAHLRPFVQVRQVVLRDPVDKSGRVRIHKQQQRVGRHHLLQERQAQQERQAASMCLTCTCKREDA